jgi:NAD(P)-dependent dehydrogenase (short-subunit alcohol dehydrogenase family)
VAATVDHAVDAFGGLDGVVMNAGIGVTGTLSELSLDQWNATQRINATSAFLLTRAAMAALTEQGMGGSLVYVASKNAFGPGAGFGAYSVSKAAMIQLMRIAALEGGAAGIRSNAVNPDAVFDNSRLWEGGLREQRAAAHGIEPADLEEFYASRNLLHRRVTTSDVAASVRFLLSDQSSRTTGAVLTVDGGVAAAFPR